MAIQTLEQKRAENAWQRAQSGVAQYESEYVNNAKGLPALIMNSGLMQVMAFLHAKEGCKADLGRDLRAWLHEQCHTSRDFESFMKELFAMDTQSFQAVTKEAFAWLRWLRQMAPACAKGD